jgi:phosphatidylinositol alpha-1,6-mannosyltransferase
MFVVITRNFPPDIGGIQSLMEGLSRGLLTYRKVKVFADETQDSKAFDEKSKLDIQRISGIKLFRKFRKAHVANDFLKQNKVKAIFFDHWKSVENIKKEFLDTIPNFCLIHSKEINHPIGTSLNTRMNKAFKKIKLIIANSKYTKSLGVNFGLEQSKIHIINPGTDYPITVNQSDKMNARSIFGNAFPKIITVARLDRRKNHQNILMTIKNLIPTYPDIKYVCIGNGEEKSNLTSLAEQLEIENYVNFFTRLDQPNKNALLNEANLFLMPAIMHKKSVEGFGISFIEAASYGVASIGGKVGGQADAIEDGRTGFLCNGNDLSSIYATILEFFQNDQYKVLGLQSKEFSKKFKWENIVKQYLSLI